MGLMLRNPKSAWPQRVFRNSVRIPSWKTLIFGWAGILIGGAIPLWASQKSLPEDARAWLNYLWFTRVEGKRPYMEMLKETLGPQDLEKLRELAQKETDAMMEANRARQRPFQMVRVLLKKTHEELPKHLLPFLEKAKEAAIGDWKRMKMAPSNGLILMYATQYYGETDTEAALPDRFIKFANRGWQFHTGYKNVPYYVFLRLQENPGNLISLVVWDVGPWNEDDNYWKDPEQRRAFPGLPKGLPEAEAAFFDGYNDGKDQFGREVLNPAGIDLTPQAAGLLGLEFLENAWVEIDTGGLP
jgi:hypothetical protein